ncbi:MAG: GGDEF domain-containing protein [bacterium]|nr:GGDEF domain-containing protein [bacterium]
MIAIDKQLEPQYREYYFKNSIKTVRTGLVLAFLLFSFFGILDYWVIPNSKYSVWLIRYAVIVPVLITIYGITYTAFFKKYIQYILFITSLFAGYAIICMIILTGKNDPGFRLYYSGLILVLVWLHTLTRLRFIYATISGIIIIGGYEFVILFIRDVPLGEPGYLNFTEFISNNFFLVSAHCIAMAASYRSESYMRRNFTLSHFLKEKAIRDGLTGLLNHTAIINKLNKLLAHNKRYGYPLTVIMFDIDDFKKVNDKYGHQTGDRVIQSIASVIKDSTREVDFSGRYGGEEYMVILPSVELANGLIVAEKIRRSVENLDLSPGPRVTISGGCAEWEDEDTEALIEKSDKLLYAAKKKGKNRDN